MLLLLLSCNGDPDDPVAPTDDSEVQTDDSQTDDSDPEGEVTEVIGPDGGTIEHPGGASVTVPAGALDADVEITIRQLEDGEVELPADDVVTAAWDFGPDDTTFSEPVTVTLPVTGTVDEDEDVLLGYYDTTDAAWYVVEFIDEDDDHTANTHVFDRDAMTISADTEHFTAFLGGSNALRNQTTYSSGEFSMEAWDVRCSGGSFNHLVAIPFIRGLNNASGSPSTTALWGWNNENPDYVSLISSGETQLGTLSSWTVDGEVVLRIAAAGGSGGTPGGTADYYSFPGWFGFAGGQGTVSGP